MRLFIFCLMVVAAARAQVGIDERPAVRWLVSGLNSSAYALNAQNPSTFAMTSRSESGVGGTNGTRIFNGSGWLDNTSLFGGGRRVSFCAWLYSTSSLAAGQIAFRSGNANFQIGGSATTTTGISLVVRTTTNSPTTLATLAVDTAIPSLGAWTHLAVTYSTDGVMRAYRNGIFVGAATSPSPTVAFVNSGGTGTSSSNLLIGANNGIPYGGDRWKGGIADVRVYTNYVLSVSDIQRIYAGGKP